MIVSLIGIGIGKDGQPLLSLCYGSDSMDCLKKLLQLTAVFSLLACSSVTFLSCVFVRPNVQVFLSTPDALAPGVTFSRIMLSTARLFGFYYTLLNAPQAVGAAVPSLWFSICYQGILDSPALCIFGAATGNIGLARTPPAAVVTSLERTIVLNLLMIQKKRNAGGKRRRLFITGGSA